MKEIDTHKDGREWELFWNQDPPETNARLSAKFLG
jgi:hypothetical protein